MDNYKKIYNKHTLKFMKSYTYITILLYLFNKSQFFQNPTILPTVVWTTYLWWRCMCRSTSHRSICGRCRSCPHWSRPAPEPCRWPQNPVPCCLGSWIFVLILIAEVFGYRWAVIVGGAGDSVVAVVGWRSVCYRGVAAGSCACLCIRWICLFVVARSCSA